MIVPRIARRVLRAQIGSSRSGSTSSLFTLSVPSTIHRPGVGAALFRPYSQNHSYDESHNNLLGENSLRFMTLIATSAAAGVSFLGASSSSSQTLCESRDESTEAEPQTEPEIDPYDNLPEEDEPTHCSICLTYRKVGCSSSFNNGKYDESLPCDVLLLSDFFSPSIHYRLHF